jgi:hypothetical protein
MLENAIRENLGTGLAVWLTHDNRYQAQRRNGDGSFTVQIRNDPIEALLAALGAQKPIEVDLFS